MVNIVNVAYLFPLKCMLQNKQFLEKWMSVLSSCWHWSIPFYNKYFIKYSQICLAIIQSWCYIWTPHVHNTNWLYSGLEITAGQRIISGQNKGLLSGHTLALPVIFTGHIKFDWSAKEQTYFRLHLKMNAADKNITYIFTLLPIRHLC